MKSVLVAVVLLLGNSWCLADDYSGPNHTTIIRTAWGSIFYDPISMGAHKYEYMLDDIRIKSSSGEIRVLGSDTNGYRLTYGNDLLTIRSTFSGFEFRWQKKSWTLRSQNGRYTLVSSAPEDTIEFDRNANTFTIKGTKGFVSVVTNPGLLSIKSSAGTASVTNYLGSRSFSGASFDQLPYFGRGLYISFHGVGILIDMVKLFPTPEVIEWIEWKPLFGQPFDPSPL